MKYRLSDRQALIAALAPSFWELDLNQRLRGYEPRTLPDCAIPV